MGFAGWGRFGRAVVLAGFGCVVAFSGCGGGEPEIPDTRVTIKTEPVDGAELLLDGAPQGLTPVLIEGQEPGWYNVIVRKDNYSLASDRIQISEGDYKTFVLEMTPLTGSLTLESSPDGAKIFINGEHEGLYTPLYNHKLPIGEHTYKLAIENYYPIEKTLSVEEDFRYAFKHELTPMEATLKVFSRPSRARIFINGEEQLELTPSQFTLPPGQYMVDVYAKGHVQKAVKVALEPNEEREVDITMRTGEVPQGMVLVPAGEFIFGADERAPDEGPKRKIFLDAFYIDKFEVTNLQYQQVYPEHKFARGQEELPVTGVSWEKATQYASRVGKRLPTEAEWEKAARGVDGREFPWGGTFNKEYANTAERNTKGPMKVGKLLGGASPYGCMDMCGNVYEWVSDWYEAYPGNKNVTKDYGQVFRVLRGGSFRTEAFEARCARRHFDRISTGEPDYGFRCAKDVE